MKPSFGIAGLSRRLSSGVCRFQSLASFVFGCVMDNLTPIETIYNGLRFRSRLEARWAVFYDTIGVDYEYEPEGYKLDGVKYLPDFWITHLKCFIEIKGIITEDSNIKASQLAEQSKCMVYVFSEIPNPQSPSSNDSCYNTKCGAEAFFAEGSDWPYLWCECRECKEVGIEFDGRSSRIKHLKNCSIKNGHKAYNAWSFRLTQGYLAARIARFEFDR